MTSKDLAILSAMITPAVLILASSSLILATSQRLSRIMERARRLNAHFQDFYDSDNINKLESNFYEILHYTLQRVGVVEDVAQAALWLASDESDYVVGTTLYVDGGMKLYPEFKEGG